MNLFEIFLKLSHILSDLDIKFKKLLFDCLIFVVIK
jgi:hypothetical protein